MSWPTSSRLFHWTVTLLVFITIPIGIAMTSEGFEGVRDRLFVAHKGIGVVILVLVPLRALWRWIRPRPPLPDAIPPQERRLAHATHVLLYLLLLVMALSGYLRTVGGGFPIELLDALGIPPLVGELPTWAERFSVLHYFTSYLLVFVIALHVGAVLQHTLFGRVDVLSRMWPPVRGSTEERDDDGPENDGAITDASGRDRA